MASAGSRDEIRRRWGILSWAPVLLSCSSSGNQDRPLFGELPYPLPTAGTKTQSIAMTKLHGSAGDLLLESGCVTFAEVHCDEPSPCGSHANGSAAGTTTDCSWAENPESLPLCKAQ